MSLTGNIWKRMIVGNTTYVTSWDKTTTQDFRLRSDSSPRVAVPVVAKQRSVGKRKKARESVVVR
jgi:hypothetical protein